MMRTADLTDSALHLCTAARTASDIRSSKHGPLQWAEGPYHTQLSCCQSQA